jgi:LPS export ABC transporter protein LptC
MRRVRRHFLLSVVTLVLGAWSQVAANVKPTMLLLDGAVVGSDIVAVGERGTILRSADSGRSWVAAAVPTRTTLTGVSFAPDGRLVLRIEGSQMRHYPATDRIEIDGVRLRAIAEDGRVTLARAARALANGDGSEVQLLGGAEVTSQDAQGAPLLLRSEFLHAFLVTERVSTHLPVLVQASGSEMRAAAMTYDHGAGRLELQGPMRAVMPPRASKPGPAR